MKLQPITVEIVRLYGKYRMRRLRYKLFSSSGFDLNSLIPTNDNGMTWNKTIKRKLAPWWLPKK
jgi:hypothetical protein